MSRRKYNRSSPLEDIMFIASKLPWWLGLLLGGVFYMVLAHYATPLPPPTVTTPSALGGRFLYSAMIPVICGILQYVIPAAFWFGSFLSLLGEVFPNLKQKK